MKTANCPNCGAPVNFRWSQAVQTVCEYCRSILVRHDVDLEKVGSVASLPENASPIQLGTEGVYQGEAFQVVGRILYVYENGGWNEWHFITSKGISGWLSDAQLEYAVSFFSPESSLPPDAEAVSRGQRFTWADGVYEVTSLTEARYAGVEGDLPFEYWDKSSVIFADLRTHDGRFATIDYSDDPPLLFLGRAVDFRELQLKNTRIFEGWRV